MHMLIIANTSTNTPKTAWSMWNATQF